MILGIAGAALALAGIAHCALRPRVKVALALLVLACAASPFAPHEQPAADDSESYDTTALCVGTRANLEVVRADVVTNNKAFRRIDHPMEYWAGTLTTLGAINDVCLPELARFSCATALVVPIGDVQFVPRLDALIHSYQTGEPCR